MDLAGELERVFSETAPRLWRALYAFTCDKELSSDAVAEAFAQVLRRGEGVHDVAAWVWTAAFRIAAGELKRRGQVEYFRDAAYEDARPERLDIVRGLKTLGPAQREMIVLYYYGDYSAAEIGRMLGVSAGAVRVQLMRGRRRLARFLRGVD